MSGQLLELIIFAGIAFFIINKLISILGSTSSDEPSKNKSFFGEAFGGNLKDVTHTGSKNILKPGFLKRNKTNFDSFILSENKVSVEKGLLELLRKDSSFDIKRFIDGSKMAFSMILKAVMEGDDSQLEELVDKRYIDSVKSMKEDYGQLTDDNKKLSAQISEIYMFGNNVFIKVFLSGTNITQKIKNFSEEWTFSKSILSDSPIWYLTNVDKP